jgi:hypothetical protein
MIKLILSGLWVCLVTLLSTYGVITWHGPVATATPPPPAQQPALAAGPASKPKPKSEHDAAALLAGMESIKTKMISVPVVTDNAVQGYVMAQFVITVDSKEMKRFTIKPDIFLVDEAFRAIFSGGTIDFRSFKKQDLAGLTKQIAGNVNQRLGVRIVEDVLVHELSYIPKDQVRGGQATERPGRVH